MLRTVKTDGILDHDDKDCCPGEWDKHPSDSPGHFTKAFLFNPEKDEKYEHPDEKHQSPLKGFGRCGRRFVQPSNISYNLLLLLIR